MMIRTNHQNTLNVESNLYRIEIDPHQKQVIWEGKNISNKIKRDSSVLQLSILFQNIAKLYQETIKGSYNVSLREKDRGSSMHHLVPISKIEIFRVN